MADDAQKVLAAERRQTERYRNRMAYEDSQDPESPQGEEDTVIQIADNISYNQPASNVGLSTAGKALLLVTGAALGGGAGLAAPAVMKMLKPQVVPPPMIQPKNQDQDTKYLLRIVPKEE